MGRRKIAIEPLKNDRNRTVTFTKRKAGLFKKAHELAVLCEVDISVIIIGRNHKIYQYSSDKTENILNRFTENSKNLYESKLPKDYGEYELKSRILGENALNKHRHSNSISIVNNSNKKDSSKKLVKKHQRSRSDIVYGYNNNNNNNNDGSDDDDSGGNDDDEDDDDDEDEEEDDGEDDYSEENNDQNHIHNPDDNEDGGDNSDNDEDRDHDQDEDHDKRPKTRGNTRTLKNIKKKGKIPNATTNNRKREYNPSFDRSQGKRQKINNVNNNDNMQNIPKSATSTTYVYTPPLDPKTPELGVQENSYMSHSSANVTPYHPSSALKRSKLKENNNNINLKRPTLSLKIPTIDNRNLSDVSTITAAESSNKTASTSSNAKDVSSSNEKISANLDINVNSNSNLENFKKYNKLNGENNKNKNNGDMNISLP
ncbi:hypothetical protein C6P40_003480, partial [Pichia californica]